MGLHLFNEHLENEDFFEAPLEILKQSISNFTKTASNDAWFPMLNHKDETLVSRFKTLFFGPLVDIHKLTELDYKEHGLEKLIGKSYQSSTMNEFLSGLEYIQAGKELLKLLIPSDPGKFCYIDGHMIAFWSSQSMHKGKITMLGRIMSGSNALVAHDDKGRAIYVEYYPPDIRMPGIILQYCDHISDVAGIKLFVIDREANSLEVALEFEMKNLGLLSMLNSNQFKGLSDWAYKYIGKDENGSKVYAGQWQDEKKRDEDPRYFVIVDNGEKLLPYWGTSRIMASLHPIRWPQVYSERTENQENSFKRMKKHGALETNYGTKKIWGPDRHQQRANEELRAKSASIQEKKDKHDKKIEEQELKVKESESKNHPKLLSNRQNKLAELKKELKDIELKEEQIQDKIEQNGPPKERADRDFTKQLVMTVRTLCLENCLIAFFNILLQNTNLNIGLDNFIEVFFKRNGSYFETCSKANYIFNCNGLSKSYRQKMKVILDGFNALKLTRNGKIIKAQIRGTPA